MSTWRPVKGYEEFYEVSSNGSVRSLDRPKRLGLGQGRGSGKVGKVLKKGQGRGGYHIVCLSKDAHSKTFQVHRLVLETFVSACPEGQEARHLNGDKQDNRLSNLCWGSKSENTLDQVRMGTHRNSRKTHCLRGHLLEGVNLLVANLKHGQRACKACFHARRYVKVHPELDIFDVSNNYYTRIAAGELK